MNFCITRFQIHISAFLADENDRLNIILSQDSRPPRRGRSPELAELIAVDGSFKSIENISQLVDKLLRADIPVVAYIACETLRTNLMN